MAGVVRWLGGRTGQLTGTGDMGGGVWDTSGADSEKIQPSVGNLKSYRIKYREGWLV